MVNYYFLNIDGLHFCTAEIYVPQEYFRMCNIRCQLMVLFYGFIFQQQKHLAKWGQRFVKNCYINLVFRQKTQNFVHFRPYDLVQISLACVLNTQQIMYVENSLSVSAFATEERKSCSGKFATNIAQKFYVIITNADIGSRKSLHTLFYKYLDQMLVR